MGRGGAECAREHCPSGRCENAADCSDEGALAKSVIFARAVRLLKSITSLVILSGAARRAAQSKDLYENSDNIRIEIPRGARDDRELFSDARYLIMKKYDFAVCNLGAAVTLLREVIF